MNHRVDLKHSRAEKHSNKGSLRVPPCFPVFRVGKTVPTDSWAGGGDKVTNTKLDSELESRSISERHSCSGSATNDLTIHRSDCKIYKYIPINPNSLQLTEAQKCLQPLQCRVTGGEGFWGQVRVATGNPNQLWPKYLTFANFTKSYDLVNTLLGPLTMDFPL